MIPLKLELKNFTSYKEATLDFTQFQTACIIGPNGAGKSSIIEAITWCLWGIARKAQGEKKASTSLLHNEETNMKISFTFKIREDIYTVTRSYSKHESGDKNSVSIYNSSNKPISKGIPYTKVQELIDEIIGMNYNTFINSSFLLQGKANEFSKKSPKDRKETLGNILGLEIYGTLLEEARLKLREHKTKKEVLEQEILIKKQELILTDNPTQLIPKIEANLNVTDIKIKVVKRELQELTKKDKLLTEKTIELKNLVNKTTDLTSNCNEYNRNLEVKTKTLEELTQLKQNSSIILKEYDDIEKELSNISPNLIQLNIKQTDYNIINNRIQQTIINLTSTLNNIYLLRNKELGFFDLEISKVEEIPNIIQSLQTLLKEIHEIELYLKSEQNKHNLFNQSLKEQHNIINKHTTSIETINSKLEGIDIEITEISQSISTIKNIGSTNPSCPLCTQILQDPAKLLTTLRSKLDSLAKKGNSFKAEIEAIEIYKKFSEGKIKVIETNKTNLVPETEIIRDINKFESKKHDLTTLIAQLETDTQTILNTEKEISFHKCKSEDTLLLKKLAEEISILQEQTKEYQSLSTKFDSLKNQKLLITNRLSQEISIKESITQFIKDVENIKNEISTIAKTSVNLTNEVNKLTEIIPIIKTKQDELEILDQERNTLLSDKQVQIKMLEWLDEKEKYLNNLNNSLVELNDLVDIYEKLSIMFSKNGIPALIIENSIPEVEAETNSILHKLTKGKMSLIIESTKNIKTGESRETLNIKIKDGINIRDYDMYSGGECFKIDFSLRIAISKLLARKAGVQLKTLVIDEGFGSQDSEGIDTLIEAINIISKEFEKVIIITHLDKLKEAFPINIEVSKSNKGSIIEIK